jgi:Tfp pilus assembly protein PilZ
MAAAELEVDRNLKANEPKPGLLTLSIKDKGALYQAYLPFVKNGGIFVPTNTAYRFGDEVFVLLSLLEEPEKIPVVGRVIWKTPKVPSADDPRESACRSARAIAVSHKRKSRAIWPAPWAATGPRTRCSTRVFCPAATGIDDRARNQAEDRRR